MLFQTLAWLVVAASAEDARNVDVPHFNTHFEVEGPFNLAGWEARKQMLREQILHAAGLPLHPRRRTAPGVRISQRIQTRDYRVLTLLVETMPGYFVGADLYLPPASRKGPYPAVLSPHGHWKQGRRTHLPDYSVPSLGINLALQGYAVLAWDMVGYGDAKQLPHDFSTKKRQLWGFTPLGLQLHNSIRMLDYLESLPEVRPSYIGITGASGGGTQTFLLAAVDRRIRVSAPVNMVSSYMQGGDPCEEAPGLRLGTNNTEFAAMMAPRPMLLVSASGDWTKHTPQEEFPSIQGIYGLYGARQNVENAHFQAKHNYNKASREAVYRFFAKHLNPKADPVEAVSFELVLERHASNLLLAPNQTLPAHAHSMESLDEQMRSQVMAPPRTKREEMSLRRQLRMSMGVTPPGPVREERSKGVLRLERINGGEVLTAILEAGEGHIVVLVDPRGAEVALRSEQAKELSRRGYTVLALQPFRSSRERTLRQRADRWFNSYNQEDVGAQVNDILTALEYARSLNPKKPSVMGVGAAAVWVNLAAATASAPVDLLREQAPIQISDKQWEEDYFIPGIMRLGGWTVVERLALWH